jgi:hypothetical protein
VEEGAVASAVGAVDLDATVSLRLDNSTNVFAMPREIKDFHLVFCG